MKSPRYANPYDLSDMPAWHDFPAEFPDATYPSTKHDAERDKLRAALVHIRALLVQLDDTYKSTEAWVLTDDIKAAVDDALKDTDKRPNSLPEPPQ
jgi:hypothetical protein